MQSGYFMGNSAIKFVHPHQVLSWLIASQHGVLSISQVKPTYFAHFGLAPHLVTS